MGDDVPLSSGGSDERVAYLSKLICAGTQEFSNKQAVNKRSTYFFRVSIIVFGALTTVILGTKSVLGGAIGSKLELAMSAIALVVSALVTVASACDALVQPGLKWIEARRMVSGFRQIREDLEFRLRGPEPLTQAESEALYKQVKALRRSYDEGWASNRAAAIHGAAGKRR